MMVCAGQGKSGISVEKKKYSTMEIILSAAENQFSTTYVANVSHNMHSLKD